MDGADAAPRRDRIWRVTFIAPSAPAIELDAGRMAAAADGQRPMAFEYSEAYNVRRKIHMAASFATIPLFVAQVIVGQQLYDGTAESNTSDLHGALTAGIAALFVVNTVTGAWNLWDGRSDPNGRTRRLVHGLIMFGANIGFVATGALAPDDDEGGGNRSAHRNTAIASMSAATASYLYMLFTR